VNRSTSYTQIGTHPVKMTNADQNVEAFLQRGLHLTARRLLRLTAARFQKRAHRLAQLGWMPMPSVLQSGFSPQTNIAQQLVSC